MSWVFNGKNKKVLQSLKLLGPHSIGLNDIKHGSMKTISLHVTFGGGVGEKEVNVDKKWEASFKAS